MPHPIITRPPPPADNRIAWGEDPLQFADLRRPEGRGPHPAVITIHGGYWRNRYGLDHLGHLCAALTAQGAVTWNLEYRRVGDPGGGWPGTFKDIAGGSRYLVDHARELDIDPSRVIVLGHSAGGHLAAWLASMPNVPVDSAVRAEPLALRGAATLAGLLDLQRAWELHLSDDAVVELLGGSPQKVPNRYLTASPIALVPTAMPILIAHGMDDDIVPIEMSERYRAAILRTGGVAAMPMLPRTDHFDIIDPDSRAWPTVAAAVRALLT